MGKLSGNVKQLCGYLNQVFPGGALFLVTTEAELKQLLMELTGDLLQTDECRHVSAARMIGLNSFPDREDSVWVISPEVIISNGAVLTDEDSPVLWLERPLGFTNALISDSLSCSITTPLDQGEALFDLCQAIQAFMPENFIPTVAVMACSIMGASYKHVIAKSGRMGGVPFLFAEPGTCKSEALKCGLALFGAQKTHLYNNQTTPFLFDMLKPTTIKIGVDDSEKHRILGRS